MAHPPLSTPLLIPIKIIKLDDRVQECPLGKPQNCIVINNTVKKLKNVLYVSGSWPRSILFRERLCPKKLLYVPNIIVIRSLVLEKLQSNLMKTCFKCKDHERDCIVQNPLWATPKNTLRRSYVPNLIVIRRVVLEELLYNLTKNIC